VNRINLAALQGQAGTLLFDPIDISITSGVSGTNPITGSPVITNTLLDGDISDFLQNTGSLEITTSPGVGYPGDIYLSSPTIAWTSANDLTITANRSINLDDATISSTAGDITLNANTANTATGGFTGISINGTSQISSTTGVITLTGIGGAGIGAGTYRGIYVGNSASITTGSNVTTGGSITITGTASPAVGIGTFREGFTNTGTIAAIGTGGISITGTGGEVLTTMWEY
jgi:hypothetical protein